MISACTGDHSSLRGNSLADSTAAQTHIVQKRWLLPLLVLSMTFTSACLRLQLDLVRGKYWLKDAKLVAALLLAAQMEPNSSNAQRAKLWKDPATVKHGAFAKVMQHVCPHHYDAMSVLIGQSSFCRADMTLLQSVLIRVFCLIRIEL